MDTSDKQGSKNSLTRVKEEAEINSVGLNSASSVDSASKENVCEKEVLSYLGLSNQNNLEVKCEETPTEDDSKLSCGSDSIDYMCLACSKPFPDPGSLEVHLLTHVEERMYLGEMDPSEDDNSQIVKNMFFSKTKKALDKARPVYQCSICNKEFDQKQLWKSHLLDEHDEERPYRCQVCGKGFKSVCDFKRHEMIHTGMKPHRCKICEKSFNQPGPLKRHLEMHAGDKRFQCQECDETFTQREHLERHKATHLGEKLFRCSVCDKYFARKDNLTRHALVHGERNFECSLCGKSFYRKDDLNAHILSHNVERPYKCADCGKSFAKRGGLQLHTASHVKDQDRPYSCDKCDKKFALKHHLSKHLKIHDKEWG